MSEETRKLVPPVVHPVIRTHPVTKKKALYVNQGFTRRIQGLSEDESRALLDFLFMHSTRPEFVYRHKWSVGDVVMWDNGCVLHRADHSGVVGDRVMHRGMSRGYAIASPQ